VSASAIWAAHAAAFSGGLDFGSTLAHGVLAPRHRAAP
jgi:hypothetical protein